MNSIEDKLKLYSNTYVKGEVRGKNYEAKLKQEKALNFKLDLADTLFNEVYFPFTQSQKDHVKILIKTFTNFNELYPKASAEEIITAFIFYVKALEEKKETQIQTIEGQKTIRAVIPKIEKQLRFPETFEIISWKITLHYVSKTPIQPTQPHNIDHNILYKG